MSFYEDWKSNNTRILYDLYPCEIQCNRTNCLFRGLNGLCTYPGKVVDKSSFSVDCCKDFILVRTALCYVIADIMRKFRNGET